jgi:hypothetical protein
MACPIVASSPTNTNSLETIISDMQGLHEGRMHGVPDSYDWARGPRLGMGNNPGNFRAIIAWGQVYEAAEGNPATNSRVQIKNIETHILGKDGRWNRVQFSITVEGGAFVEDFRGNTSKAADVRTEPGGGVSVTAGGGFNVHFWTAGGRAAIDPANVRGVFTTFKARLVLNNPTRPDDRTRARYVASAGADYWLNTTAQWADFKTNGDAGIGKAKYVRSEWRSFNMHTLTPDELRRNPPPF